MQHTVSTKTLVKASITATIVAAIALVTFILPAEYNIDQLGVLLLVDLRARYRRDIAEISPRSRRDIAEITPRFRGVERCE